MDNRVPEKLLNYISGIELVNRELTRIEYGEVNVKAELVNFYDEVISIAFTVQDTGIGIAEDKITAIFEPFTQATKDTNRKFGGTGLGLSISQKLLEIQQSQLKVESKVNQGTTFSFILNFKSVKEDSKANLSINPKQGQHRGGIMNIKVLVAEDNIMNTIVIKQFLKKWGVEFQIVENGELAVEAVRKEQFDIVLMDLNMPVMDRFTASIEIRKFNQKIPIIALTASATTDAQLDGNSAGMNDFAIKPFIPEELYNKIERNLSLCYENHDLG